MGPGRARLLTALVSLLALVSAGCWDRVEVNDLAIISGVALDKAGPNSLQLTVALAVPSRIRPPGSPGGGGQTLPPTVTVAAQGRTILDAMATMQEKVGRRLFWAHNAVILVGEDLARDGIAPVLDFFTRHRQPRLRTVLAVVPGRARDVLATTPVIEPSTPMALRKISNMRTTVATSVRDFLRMLLLEGEEPIAPRLEVVHPGVPQPGMLEAPPGGPTGGSPLVQREPPQPAFTGAALFKGDRLVGFLDAVDTRGVLWLRNELARTTVTVPLGRSGRWVSFELVRASTELKPRFDPGRVTMVARMSAEGELDENGAGVDASDPAALALLEEALAREIARRTRAAAEKVQRRFRTDVLGFGEAVRRSDPARWKQLKERWDAIFPQVGLELHVRAFIRRTGLASKPPGMKGQRLLTAEELKRMLRGR